MILCQSITDTCSCITITDTCNCITITDTFSCVCECTVVLCILVQLLAKIHLLTQILVVQCTIPAQILCR